MIIWNSYGSENDKIWFDTILWQLTKKDEKKWKQIKGQEREMKKTKEEREKRIHSMEVKRKTTAAGWSILQVSAVKHLSVKKCQGGPKETTESGALKKKKKRKSLKGEQSLEEDGARLTAAGGWKSPFFPLHFLASHVNTRLAVPLMCAWILRAYFQCSKSRVGMPGD